MKKIGSITTYKKGFSWSGSLPSYIDFSETDFDYMVVEYGFDSYIITENDLIKLLNQLTGKTEFGSIVKRHVDDSLYCNTDHLKVVSNSSCDVCNKTLEYFGFEDSNSQEYEYAVCVDCETGKLIFGD